MHGLADPEASGSSDWMIACCYCTRSTQAVGYNPCLNMSNVSGRSRFHDWRQGTAPAFRQDLAGANSFEDRCKMVVLSLNKPLTNL